MIFQLYCALIMAGYSACGLLLGSYIKKYTGASSLDLGFIFMLQPLTIFARPFICSYADRYQNHKKLLCLCLFITSTAYVPFIIIPYYIDAPGFQEILTPRVLYWLFGGFHLLGSIGFCGTRSLGDALAVNYAKRVGSDFTLYRKYGAISFGSCAYLLGMINQGWLMPDFVPTLVVYVVSMFTLMVLVFLWPQEYFKMLPKGAEESKSLNRLPQGWEVVEHMRRKLTNWSFGDEKVQDQIRDSKTETMVQDEKPRKYLSSKQQAVIFCLLLRRDIRIPLYLLLLTFVGFCAYAPQNFLFTYMNQVCHHRGTCDGAFMSGLVMISYCTVETTCYLIINALRKHLNYGLVLSVTMASICIHYNFYGFFISHVSPFFFLIESLHGLEYSTTLSSSMELGYRFASEVELLIPELIEKKIISKGDDLELVSLSLMATMSGCFTLVHDGIGTMIGAFVYGLLIDTYSFTTTWKFIGSMGGLGFISIITTMALGKLLRIHPARKLYANSNSAPV